MNNALEEVERLQSVHPNSATLRDAYARLLDAKQHADRDPKGVWEVFQNEISALGIAGLLGEDGSGDILLEQVRAELAADSIPSGAAPVVAPLHLTSSSQSHQEMQNEYDRNISVVPPPPIPSTLRPLSTTTVLPMELLDVLNQTYFLHVLATDEHKILPPGKSLLSVMSDPTTAIASSKDSTVHSAVESMVHKAFWGEALEALSSPTPSVQIPRLKRLYEDLHILLVPILPPSHPVLITLSSPLSPTSAPLRSAVAHLREVLGSLRQRCAPFRDPTVDELLQKIEDPPTADLPQILIETVGGTFKLAEAMKEDLSQFVMGTMGENELQSAIKGQAQEREREFVNQIWGREKVDSTWTEWLDTLDETTVLGQMPAISTQKWTVRLIQALGSTSPVSCSIPISPSDSDDVPVTAPPNQLPPPFFFVAPTLLNIQNYLQALVIAATLRSLVRLPPHSLSQSPSPSEDFMSRIWTLLCDEIDNESGDTKLINLADEIIRVRGLVGGSIGEDEEEKLRAAVDRTLQTADPVFQLLQRRLLRAVAERLVSPLSTGASEPAQSLPTRLQSGRGPRHDEKKPRFRLGLLGGSGSASSPKPSEALVSVKGFDDAVMTKAVTREVERLRSSIEWMGDGWGDVVISND
ncbi:hypothetical protein EIP91_007344 [Steccherinum ochraceum]|uniref:Uncharacterized protein n=1 Tax=Steccherinum ochraceum TaxID=92696 RepID=A0A4V2MXV3_9APHY|nr:hypothetical protein EIP91_007344 [Steccherinum ochraceum]